jgi:hypothetical protein
MVCSAVGITDLAWNATTTGTKWLTPFILFNKLIAIRANNSKLLLLHS